MKAKVAERIVYENRTLKYRGPLLVLYMYIDFFLEACICTYPGFGDDDNDDDGCAMKR